MTNAENLREEAEKLESSKGGFFAKVFGGGNDKLEEACEKYTQAGSRFKGGMIKLLENSFDALYNKVFSRSKVVGRRRVLSKSKYNSNDQT